MDDGNQLAVVEEMRLLGVQVRSDLSWKSNTTAICQLPKCLFKVLDVEKAETSFATMEELLEVYDKLIRCTVEFSTPVWTSGLTQAEINQIERIQKAAFAIILGKGYTSYSRALK